MKGTTVYLVHRETTGNDGFNQPIYEETLEPVDDVLVGSPSSDDVTDTTNLYGKKLVFVLGIPKGDSHNWVDAVVEIWGERYRTIGYPTTGIQENIPLRWGQNVKVERYG